MWLGTARAAHADGEMWLGERVLFREGPAPDVCREHDRECEVAETKILSGYGYLRGHLIGAAGFAAQPAGASFSGLAALQLTAASAALPGGDLSVARIDGMLASRGVPRLRLALAEAEGLFFCSDARSDAIKLPFLGMTTSHCRPDAVIALDARVGALQWEIARRVRVEWFSLGPSFELLGNGLGYAHLLRSVMLGLSFDLRTTYALDPQRPSRTNLGAGLRAALLWRLPHWELRLRARQRSALLGGKGMLRDNGVVAELHLLHNFLWSDALLLQAGLTASVSYYREPSSAFELWAPPDQRWGGWFGLYLGWLHAPPDI